MRCWVRSATCTALAVCAATLLLSCAGNAAVREEGGRPGMLAERPPIWVESSAWTFQGASGMAYTTAHYRLLTTVYRDLLRDRLPGFAEASLARFSEAFPEMPTPTGGLEVFVLSSRPEWERFVTEVYGTEGLERYGAIERGGFTQRGRAVLWDIGVQDTMAILAHEGWHQYAQVSLREPLPSWLDEGLAVWAEGFRWDAYRPHEPIFLPWANVERFDQLRHAASRDGLMPLEQLLTERPQALIQVSSESTLTYYAQCWALAHFVMSDPDRRAALGRLLEDAAAGRMMSRLEQRYGSRAARAAVLRRSGIEVWRMYFGEDLDSDNQAFAAYLKALVAPGSKNRIVRGESPFGR